MKIFIQFTFCLMIGTGLSAQNALLVPPTLTGTTFNLAMQDGTHEFTSGVVTQTRGFNGSILGPTLIFEQGEVVDISVDNQLNETTTVHWHGMHVPPIADGGPHTPILVGATWNPSFTVMDKATTFWYHPHLHEHTYEQVHDGLAGFIIVKDAEEAALNLPRTYGVDDIPVVFQTKVMDGSGQIDSDPLNSAKDHLVTANATVDAYFNAPAQVIRLRLLNGASERTFNIGLSNNADFHVIGSDGGLLEAPVQMNRLQFSQGERYEILIDLIGMNGTSVDIVNYGSTLPNGVYGTDPSNMGMGPASIPNYATNPLNGSDFALLTLNVGPPTANPVTSVPSVLVTVNQWNVADVDENRTILMSAVVGGAQGALNGPFQLNNAPFNMSVVNEEIPLNNTEIWTLTNQSQIAHPFHIHDVQFNILRLRRLKPTTTHARLERRGSGATILRNGHFHHPF